jgi:hypothetical protein
VKLKLKSIVAAFLLACLPSIIPAQGLKVDFAPVFQGDSTGPVLVTMQNPGRPLVGQIRSSGSVNTVLYPVELPTGSVKQVIVYRTQNYYDSGQIKFEAGPRVIEAPLSYSYDMLRLRSAVIHDEPDAVVQMSKADPLKKLSAGLYPARAEAAPDRTSGYDSFSSVWLGQGSDRLNDAQVLAVKQFLLQGGCVVFIGGAGNSALRDPRWQDVVGEKAQGLTNGRASLLSGIPAATFGAVDLPSSAWANPQFNGYGGYKSIGAGRAVILRFSPFDQAFINSGTASRIAAKVHTLIPKRDSFDIFIDNSGFQPQEDSYYPGYQDTTNTNSSGAFTYEAPEAGQLFTPVWIFALILAPLSILIPRFLKRAELAWIFAPVAAIGVAAMVMSSQNALRSSTQAQVTTGSIFAHEGVATSVAVFNTELFFPRSGRFNLNMELMERAEIQGGSSGFMGNSSTTYELGGRMIPPITVKNLEFRSLAARTAIEGASGWISYTINPAKKELIVTNRSAYQIRSVRLGAGKESGPLAPGKSVTVKPVAGQRDNNLIFCTFEDLEFGPTIGKATSTIILNYRMKGNTW